MKRNRQYNGQSHTDQGERGKTLVEGLTMRDICDCFIKAVLISSPPKIKDFYDRHSEYIKYDEIGNQVLTQKALDNIDDLISYKVNAEIWEYKDVYSANWDEIDPIAIAQNLTCEIEKMMGIFPNLPKTEVIE